MNLYRAYRVTFLLLLTIFFSCNITPAKHNSSDALIAGTITPIKDTVKITNQAHLVDSSMIDHTKTVIRELPKDIININTGRTDPDELIAFAKTLIGVPYVYASTNPKVGFDCSGFITYVFNHFSIQVPRSSIDFTNVGTTVAVENAKQGDIILFTGTNEMERDIDHMGLVVSNDNNGLQFIHATSSKIMAVTITQLNEQYKKRFIRISRIFKQNS